jgi:ATP-binding cassette subfamily F protein uup
LDNVVTSTLVFEGEGLVREYVGGYQDWLRQGGSPRLLGVGESKSGKAALATAVVPVVVSEPLVTATKKKLSYKVQRELEAIPALIDALEQKMAALQTEIGAASFYQRPAAETSAVLAGLEGLQQEMDAVLERWAELDA